MDKPTLKLECLRLAYDKDKTAEEVVANAKKFWDFILLSCETASP